MQNPITSVNSPATGLRNKSSSNCPLQFSHAHRLCARLRQEQDNAAQQAALQAAGCELIFSETASGGRWQRPELHQLIRQLRKGDVMVVWKLARLSRSLKDVLLLMEKIHEAGAGFTSLTEAIDTTSPAGRMMMQIVASFAEFEREMLRERTKSGMQAARDSGQQMDRPNKLTVTQKLEIVRLVEGGDHSPAQVARLFKVHRATVSGLLAQARK